MCVYSVLNNFHSVRNLNIPLPKPIAKENSDRYSEIHTLFTTIATHISSGPNAWRYHYQYSFGLQEYIEARSFQHYIENQRLLSHADIVRSLPDGILVTEADYVLGLFDVTGEMMRFAVTTMTAKGITPGGAETGAGAGAGAGKDVAPAATVSQTMDGAADDDDDKPANNAAQTASPAEQEQGQGIVADLRVLRSMFERLNVPRQHGMSKELQTKMDTMQNSVEKVERAAYGLLVRGSERPTGWMPDLSSAAPVESF